MTLRRLIDLPGLADLEFKAVMSRDYAEPEARADNPELDELSRKLFGITADEAEAAAPEDFRTIDHMPAQKQADLFEEQGWDVTDNKRKPLRTLAHWNQQLWIAIHGLAGELPFVPDAEEQPERWASKLEAEANRFRKG